MKAKTGGYGAAGERLTPEESRRRNLEAYGERIRRFRTRAGLPADRLAERLGISSSSVRNWECGLTRPDPELLSRLFAVLDVEPNEFFGLGGVGTLLTAQERELLRCFRALDEAGREDVLVLTGAMGETARRRALREARSRIRAVSDWGRTASAGAGEEWPERPEREEMLLRRGPAVDRADEIVTVSGESMAPQFHDRDRVLVEHCRELRVGDIGVFYVPGYGGVIKQKAYDRLHSLNPDYDDIFPYEDGARLVGRVLGAIGRDMLPDARERALYLEAVQA